MRSRLFIVVLSGIIVSAVFLWLPQSRTAQPIVKEFLAPPASPPVPITQVILFNSGVGYFQREGEVNGNSQVDLAFPAGDVNDLLKSLVLQDTGGGKIASVTYDNQDPIEKTLQSFALDLTYNPTLGQLLNQARGEKLEVTMQTTAGGPGGTLTGIVVGMEADTQLAANSSTAASTNILSSRHKLNLRGPDGIRSIPLDKIERVRFLSPAIQSEFDHALAVLAAVHDTQKKQVRLHFTGDGKRKVRVGYVVENPVWKTSYRLALDAAGKAFLQGWALVENVSDDDWKDVRMVLVSGRPISFQMDLYPPLYVPRPIVEPEQFASLRPPNYSGPLTKEMVPAGGMAGLQGGGGLGLGGAGGLGIAGLGLGGGGIGGLGGNLGALGGFPGMQGGMVNLGGFGGNPYQLGSRAGVGWQRSIGGMQVPESDENSRLSFQELQRRRKEKSLAQKVGGAITGVDLTEGIESVASAEEIGDHFQYAIDHKVSLPRQKSAMLPIVNKDVQVSRVSIFNPAVHPKFPLMGLRFKNTTGLHLMQGPITVYEAGGYAGDSRLADLQPNEERLLAYAVDLGTEVKVDEKTEPARLVAVKIVKGVLELTSKVRETKTYLVRNRSSHDRVLLIELPARAYWKLIVPEKPAERSRDDYRFEVKVPAGQFRQHEVTEELISLRTTGLLNEEDKQLELLLAGGTVSRPIKDALQKAGDLRRRLNETLRERIRVQEELKVILDDQDRLRQDLKTVPADSALHRRYLEKLDKQESLIEKLQDDLKTKQQLEPKQRKEYEDYLAGLNVG